MTPAIYGKLVTSPAFIDWLGEGLKIAPTNFNGIGTHMGRLTGIVQEDPLLMEPVKELLNNLGYSAQQ